MDIPDHMKITSLPHSNIVRIQSSKFDSFVSLFLDPPSIFFVSEIDEVLEEYGYVNLKVMVNQLEIPLGYMNDGVLSFRLPDSPKDSLLLYGDFFPLAAALPFMDYKGNKWKKQDSFDRIALSDKVDLFFDDDFSFKKSRIELDDIVDLKSMAENMFFTFNSANSHFRFFPSKISFRENLVLSYSAVLDFLEVFR
jgi:hypothetical protein